MIGCETGTEFQDRITIIRQHCSERKTQPTVSIRPSKENFKHVRVRWRSLLQPLHTPVEPLVAQRSERNPNEGAAAKRRRRRKRRPSRRQGRARLVNRRSKGKRRRSDGGDGNESESRRKRSRTKIKDDDVTTRRKPEAKVEVIPLPPPSSSSAANNSTEVTIKVDPVSSTDNPIVLLAFIDDKAQLSFLVDIARGY